uniref:IL7RA n=1 Tax=Hymenolepis diminuta TaxID=6216 RepID=A0A0R3SM58_HYMDI
LTNFSKWCNVEVKNLVDENYRAMERPVCMEEQVAKEVFNVTCSNSIKPNFPLSFTQFQVVSIVTGCVVGVFLIVALWLFIRWCLWRRKKPYTSGSTPVLV